MKQTALLLTVNRVVVPASPAVPDDVTVVVRQKSQRQATGVCDAKPPRARVSIRGVL